MTDSASLPLVPKETPESATPCRMCGHPKEGHDSTTHDFYGPYDHLWYAELPPQRIGAVGELRGLMAKLAKAGMDYNRREGKSTEGDWADIKAASDALESLFSRVTEERDQAREIIKSGPLIK